MIRVALLVLAISFAISSPAAPSKEQQAQKAYDRAMKVYAVDAPASIQLFQQAARMGSADAMVRLGYIFQTMGNPKHKEAIQWYKKAVEAGNTAAIFEVGSLYAKGSRGAPSNLDAAIEWYEKGVSNNSLKSCEALVHIYASAKKPEFHDGEKAVKYASVLLRKDSRSANYMDLAAAAYARNLDFKNALKAASLAVNLSPLNEAAERRERAANYKEGQPYPAIASDEWILLAAEQENLWAVMKLAEMSGDQLSEDYNPVNARHWYEIGAENINPDALLQLGYMCFNGEGGEVDMKKAFWCFSTSAENGNNQAYAPLARMYVGGKGTGQDYVKAKEWYQKALNSGKRQYNFQLNSIRMILRASSRPTPEDLFEKAQALSTTNRITRNGEVQTYSQRTLEIHQRYWLAAEQEHTGAMKELADMYFYGKRYFVREGELDRTTGGLIKNYTRALDYYRQLEHRGIEVPEMEACKEHALVELKERRARQRRNSANARRAS